MCRPCVAAAEAGAAAAALSPELLAAATLPYLPADAPALFTGRELVRPESVEAVVFTG